MIPHAQMRGMSDEMEKIALAMPEVLTKSIGVLKQKATALGRRIRGKPTRSSLLGRGKSNKSGLYSRRAGSDPELLRQSH